MESHKQDETAKIRSDRQHGGITSGEVHADIINQTTYQTTLTESEFSTPDFKYYQSFNYFSSKSTNSLVEFILNNRILVLGGETQIDKFGLSRYVAIKLQEKLQDGSLDVSILEWNHTSVPQKLIPSIKEKEPVKIFILPNVSPEHFSYNILSLKESLLEHYIIISTDIEYDKWHFEEGAKQFWHELTPDVAYSKKKLEELLLNELKDSNALARKKIEQIKDTHKISGIFFDDIVEQLKIPENIDFFVKQILPETKNENLPSGEEIYEIIKEITNQNEKERISRWFYYQLDSAQQLLALGVAIFSGLFDDQFFAAFQYVAEKAGWERRSKLLRSLDYYDLDELGHFFTFVETKNYRKIEVKSLQYRYHLFEIAWEKYRRQILFALPVLVKLIKGGTSYSNRELYGTEQLCQRLRSVIGETLSLLSLISHDTSPEGVLIHNSVEEALLQLSADKDIHVQAVAAQIMGNWRSFIGYDRLLFDTLQYWQSTAIIDEFKRVLTAYVAGYNYTEKKELSYIRATIALTVGYAAVHDSPEHLSEELYELISQLSQDPSPLVRNCFYGYTVPLIISSHRLVNIPVIKLILFSVQTMTCCVAE